MNKIKLIINFFKIRYNFLKNFKNNIYRNKSNKVIGELYREERIKYKTNKFIICDALWDNPHHWIRLAIFIPVLAKNLQSRIMGIYLKGTANETIKTFKSLNFDAYKELNLIPSSKNFLQANILSEEVKKPSDIFELNIPYGYPGSFLYDSILKSEMTGNVEINKKKLNKYLLDLLCFLDIYENLIDPKKVSAVVLSHPVNFRFSTLVYIALTKNIPVYIINYINEYITIRKLSNIQDWIEGSYENPKIEDINSLSLKKRKFLENVGTSYIEKIRSSQRGQISTIGTFNTSEEKNFNRNKFFKNLNLKSNRITAIIMSGCWPDFPNIYPKTFYIDYVDWFTKTLEIITQIDDINWIIKPHPAEFMYGSKIKSEYFLKNINKNNIKLWPKNMRSNCLLDVADVLITSHGSAGFEYTSLGKPVIVTKKTNYSDWGFVHSCLEYKKYSNLLFNLKTIKRPSIRDQKLAKIFIASHICNASDVDNKYLFKMGVLSDKLWPSIKEFILINKGNIRKERKMMSKWLKSKNQSYNFFKSINYDLWNN